MREYAIARGRLGFYSVCLVIVNATVIDLTNIPNAMWKVLMCQWFAPTKLVVTFETEGQGRFSPEELRGLVERDETGRVIRLHLPKKTVLIANHQVRRPRSVIAHSL